jgi:hypothetical protein
MDAVLPLVGVLLGAAITFVVTLYFEHRRERRRAVQAIRVTLDDLREIVTDLDIAVMARRWWSQPPRDFPLDVWRDNRATLAASVDDQVWNSVRLAYNDVRGINDRLLGARQGLVQRVWWDDPFDLPPTNVDDPRVAPPWAKVLKSHQNRIDVAIRDLAGALPRR